MIKDIQELNFPEGATLSSASVSMVDMGEWTITSQVRIDGDVREAFARDWEVVFQGHKYIMPLRRPQGSKENTSWSPVVELTFVHWAQYQLKRWYFYTVQPGDAGVAWPDKYVASVSLNLGDFCKLLGLVLERYYGDRITIELNGDWVYKAEPEVVEISYSHVWDVLLKLYEVYGVRWVIEPVEGPERYVIKVGYPATEQGHVFEYGFEGGLMRVERQVQSDEIGNMVLGRGGEKNVPYRYFKDKDEANGTFEADPDWVEELENIYFANLMPATFRSYVQGWKTAHRDKYKGYVPVGETNAYAPWAYRKGLTDERWDPVEFVADEITVEPVATDKVVEVLPGYAPWVKGDSSIAKYGPLMNGLENNEDIYPTIQGVTVEPMGRVDEVVDVEPIMSDDVGGATESDAQLSAIENCVPKTERVPANGSVVIELTGSWFTVPEDKTANFDEGRIVVKSSKIIKGKTYVFYWDFSKGRWVIDEKVTETEAETTIEGVVVTETTVVLEDGGGARVPASGIASGRYRYMVSCRVENTTGDDHKVTLSLEGPRLTSATLDDKWRDTWRIWVKNIWQSVKGERETEAQYAKRVWEPILGDRVGNEAKVVFGSGALAHEDYEFVIASMPKYDRRLCRWETVENGVRVEHEYWSEWCIELGKSDAEMEALGVYVPSVMRQAQAGDFFFLTGIDMPHLYVKWGEERVDGWKKDVLAQKCDIRPTWVVQTDRVRMNELMGTGGLVLRPGDSLRLADKRFIDGATEELYLSALTYTYREPTSEDAALNPDVEIVLSDRYEVSASPVAMLQGEVSALAKQVGSISNIEQIVRAVGDKLYLRKDGLPDRSISPTEFGSLLSSIGFRSGMVGGTGWGVYKDAGGNWVVEADRLMVREDVEVNNLVVNQVLGQGGMVVESVAAMEIVRVDEMTGGYKCYFDQHEGTVANLFRVGDVAWNNRMTPENAELKFYRRRVTEVGADYVVLTKRRDGSERPVGWPDGGVNGTGVPEAGDVIVQRGSYTDANRRYMKVRDVSGGGYERYVEGLDSVGAEGVEYYFVGRQSGMYNGRPRWYIGDEGGFIEWINGVLNIKARLNVLSTVGDKTIGEYVNEAAKGVADEVVGGLVVGSRNLLRNTGETYVTGARPGSNDWSLYVPRLSTAIPMERGAEYTIRGRSTGVFTADHVGALNGAPDDRVTLWLFDGSNYQLISDESTGEREGTTFVWNQPSGDYFVRLNSYGRVQEFTELMLVRGNCMVAEWSAAPEDGDPSIDYLKESIKNAAAESGSMIGGLILASLLRLGYTDGEGVYRTMAGINGGVDNTLAMWAGGEQIDAALDAVNGALFGVRHDGTAYAAGNTIRFMRGLIELGDNIKFTDHGLYLYDQEGATRCLISNDKMPDVGNILNGISTKVDVSPELRNVHVKNTATKGYSINTSAPMTVRILTNVAEGTSISLTCDYRVVLPIIGTAVPNVVDDDAVADDGTVMTADGNDVVLRPIYDKPVMTIELIDGADNVLQTFRCSAKSTVIKNQVLFSTAINYIAVRDIAMCSLRFSIKSDEVADDENGTWRGGNLEPVWIKGEAKVGVGQQTTIYQDGFSTAWGDVVLAADKSGSYMLAGGYGLKVTPGGIMRRDNGGDWVKM
ncbi:MAG: hypothetical protein HDR82_09660 [Bacteroides sp.]|nr:hypothetical protein [Bacteroides sp.]